MLVLSLIGGVGCKNQYRRGDDSSESSGTTQTSEQVEKRSDPRFPSGGQPDRTGIWTEQPVETGSISPTGLANAVSSRLDEVRSKCCGEELEKCRGFDGRILLKLSVGRDGSVETADIGETSVYDRDFRRCLLGEAASWTVPEPSERPPVDVYVALVLRIPESTGSQSGPAVDAGLED